MKFNKITYHNYRCFKDSEIDFRVSKDKNIVLIVAPNGGGKTEIAFSFWWVLYGFDFKSLKGKKATPYALNSTLYKKLQNSEQGAIQECSVKLEFETDEGLVYTIVRKGIFQKKNSIVESEELRLSYVDKFGVSSLPITDSNEVLHILSQIIPEKILAGLIFDGERMQQMSGDEDQKAREAIEGVIKHVTNEALFELCKNDFVKIHSNNNKELRVLAKKLGKEEVSSVESEIQVTEQEIMEYETRLSAEEENLKESTDNISSIKQQLEQHQDSKKFELLRQSYEKDLKKSERQLAHAIETFYKDLDKGYLFITPKLLNDTRESLETYDVPSGLTTHAVRSILKRDRCICGNPLNDEERTLLESLLLTLPPDNISTTILENVKAIEGAMQDASELVSRTYEDLSKCESEILDLKQKIAEISPQIMKGSPSLIRELEGSLSSYIIKKDKAEKKIEEYSKKLDEFKKRYEKLLLIRDSKTELDTRYGYFTRKDKFTKRCLEALAMIDENNKILSLQDINARINNSYSLLSSDYKMGRRLYIVTYDKKARYGMITYTQNNIEKLYGDNGAEVVSWRQSGLSEQEILEQLIIKDGITGSTGQNKVNSLAFAKAILDYSSEERDENNIVEITRSYPFLIDSPFTELDGANQVNIAENIRMFSGQIILLASQISMSGITDSIYPFVNKFYEIEKTTSEQTTINRKVI